MAETVTLHGEQEMLARTAPLFDAVSEEFLVAACDLDTWRGARRRPRTHHAHRSRKLVSPAALANEEHRRHLRQIADQGTQVRVAATPLPRSTIILDRRTMILTGPRQEYTLTVSPTLVGGVYALFEAAWESASDLADLLRTEQPELSPESRRILRALGSGATDETAARDLGMSVRTYRRRVAELLDILGADSRFQAGLRAGALGLTP
ncbi:DNA-binding response regulator [Streptomyces sp. NPDC052225]|uniref:helix-turn-helix transcriptional regulator n=1 Tax=Streptomyces sp. NPDC052225 TaxID=3154949 RepID=UPI00341826B8